MSRPASGALTVALLGVRFLVELALFAAPTVIGAVALDSAVGVVLGLLVSAAVVVLWGLVLSPKRRWDAPRGVRVALELGLIGAAGAGLALVGLEIWGVVLVAVELVSLGWLAALGLPPGTDVGSSLTSAPGDEQP
jgi:hypothetical protein